MPCGSTSPGLDNTKVDEAVVGTDDVGGGE